MAFRWVQASVAAQKEDHLRVLAALLQLCRRPQEANDLTAVVVSYAELSRLSGVPRTNIAVETRILEAGRMLTVDRNHMLGGNRYDLTILAAQPSMVLGPVPAAKPGPVLIPEPNADEVEFSRGLRLEPLIYSRGGRRFWLVSPPPLALGQLRN